MASTTIKGLDIDGLILVLDSKKITKPHVISGENFLMDVNGPHTPFGTHIVSPQVIRSPKSAESFNIAGETYYFFGTGVFKLGEPSGIFYLVHDFGVDVSLTPHKWSHAIVSCHHFFCHPAIGVIYYCPDTEYFYPHPSATLPATPTSATAVGGRLVVLGESAYSWSAQDDGLDMTPSLATGSGHQALSIIGGDSITVESILSGFMVFTTAGIIRAEFNGQVTVFQHTPVEFDYTPVNSYCVLVRHAGEILMLSDEGLYITKGQTPEVWLPMFSEFIREELLTFDISDPAAIRLDYIGKLEQLAISFSSLVTSAYSVAYFVHESVERIGVFNHGHYAFLSTELQDGALAGEHFTYINSDSRLRRIEAVPRQEAIPSNGDEYYHKAYQEFPPRWSGSAHIMPSVMRLGHLIEHEIQDPDTTDYHSLSSLTIEEAFTETAEPESISLSATHFPSYMTMRDDLVRHSWAPTAHNYLALNGTIRVGLLRWEDIPPDYPETTSLVTNVVLGSSKSGTLADVFEDWNELADTVFDEDWNLLDGDEDWGDNVISESSYGFNWLVTNDGEDIYNTVVPVVSRTYSTQIAYTLMADGVYHIAELTTSVLDQSFHLKTLEVAGSISGRL